MKLKFFWYHNRNPIWETDAIHDPPDLSYYSENSITKVSILNTKIRLSCSFGRSTNNVESHRVYEFWLTRDKLRGSLLGAALIDGDNQTVVSGLIISVNEKYSDFYIEIEIASDLSVYLNQEAPNKVAIDNWIAPTDNVAAAINWDIKQQAISTFPEFNMDIKNSLYRLSIGNDYVRAIARSGGFPDADFNRIVLKLSWTGKTKLDYLKSLAQLFFAKIRVEGDSIIVSDVDCYGESTIVDGYLLSTRLITVDEQDIISVETARAYDIAGDMVNPKDNIIKHRDGRFQYNAVIAELEGQLDNIVFPNDTIILNGVGYIVKDIKYNPILFNKKIYFAKISAIELPLEIV